VGVSNSPESWAGTHFFVKPLIDFNFPGKIYPVHPKEKELYGLTVFPSITDIPGPVDHVISAIAAKNTPQMIKECLAQGVNLVTFFSAGFSEMDPKRGEELESVLLDTAQQGNIRILGPNCMGIYCPKSRLSFDSGFPKESGPVGFISQSGGLVFRVVREAATRGIRFSKVVSYGNACDINETELLYCLAQDKETKIITIYIEGVQDGRRFFQALKEAAAIKPVIVLKGGVSKAGAGTALSHTGSLAGAERIWETVFTQSGAIRVFSPEELIDTVVSFSYPRPKGKNMVIIGLGGGASVYAADEAEKAGFSVAPLPNRIREKLGELIRVPGSIFRNPIDMVGTFSRPEEFGRVIKIIGDWREMDVLLLHLAFGVAGMGFEDLKVHQQLLPEILKAVKTLNKPAVFALSSISTPLWQEEVFQVQQQCIAAGIPVYPTLGRAIQAIGRFNISSQ